MNAIAIGTRVAASEAEEVLAPLRRLTGPVYADGVAAPRAAAADAEQVAFTVFSQGDADLPNAAGLSALWIFWGQFMDHDLSLAPEQAGEGREFLKFEGADAPFNVVRSELAPGTGSDGVPAEQLNSLTPLIDASMVYGSDAFRTALLRSFEGGRLRSVEGPDGADLLPDEADLVHPLLDYQPVGEGFAAGDVRVSENPALAAVHTVWLNEHNHWADRLAALHPDWTDEELFQAARVAVETLVQQITYEEFLPLLVGDALAPWAGFDPGVDPQVSTEFATAAYRFGHTAIPDRFRFLDEAGAPVRADAALFELFDRDDILRGSGAGAVLRGVLEGRAQELDAQVVDSLNFFLFTPDGGLTGFSLPERNILRGRDHGIAPYLEVREAVLGDIDAEALAGSTDFSVITPDAAVQAKLAAVYGTVGEVDLWVGGLAEPHAAGASIGATFRAIVAEQFAAARDGDPLFYLGREWTDPAIASELRATRFSDVLMRSGGVGHVQREAFLASDRQGGTEARDHLKGGAGRDLMIGAGGDDYLKGAGGADDLFGDAGADMLRGGAGDDGLDGGAGRDRLMGDAGADRLAGGDGADLLVGGRGADVFVLVAGETGADHLLDWEDGVDRIELRGFGVAPEAVEIRQGPFMATLWVEGARVLDVIGPERWGLDAGDIDLIG